MQKAYGTTQRPIGSALPRIELERLAAHRRGGVKREENGWFFIHWLEKPEIRTRLKQWAQTRNS